MNEGKVYFVISINVYFPMSVPSVLVPEIIQHRLNEKIKGNETLNHLPQNGTEQTRAL